MASLAIHGHFYQPDRRDPLTGDVPSDPGAAPAHDWNERIYEQCYAPNARLGNYARIGYDFGPTLLTWLRASHPGLHAAIAMQSAGSSAMAQGWHHAILPLALSRDRKTEIAWGVADFTFRFGHAPAGFWLPETAVNDKVLIDLVDEGIKYVILAPWQAAGAIDSRRPYRVDLPGGRSIVALFYDGELSSQVSFADRATENADRFVSEYVLPKCGRLPDGSEPLLLVATDGELYGHHKAFRDHFLAALPEACRRAGITMTTVGDLVGALDAAAITALTPVVITQNTAWSCHEGLGRWSAACECCADGRWKSVLRSAFNELAQTLDTASQAAFAALGLDLWSLRDRYVAVAAGFVAQEDFALAALAGSPWSDDLTSLALVIDLLSAQRSRLAMFTSCGWFWDDPSRQETMTCLAYAADAISKVRAHTGVDAEGDLVSALGTFWSPLTGKSGAVLYTQAAAKLALERPVVALSEMTDDAATLAA